MNMSRNSQHLTIIKQIKMPLTIINSCLVSSPPKGGEAGRGGVKAKFSNHPINT